MTHAGTLEAESGLADRVAIIGGGGAAGGGIGNRRAAPIPPPRSGTKVLVVDRTLSLAQRTVAMLVEAGGIGAAHQADLTDGNQVKEAVTAALDQFGRLDFLDNNIGISSRGTVVEEAPETWRRLM